MPDTKREPKPFVAVSCYLPPHLARKLKEFAATWNLSDSGAVELCLQRQLNGLEDGQVPDEIKRIGAKEKAGKK